MTKISHISWGVTTKGVTTKAFTVFLKSSIKRLTAVKLAQEQEDNNDNQSQHPLKSAFKRNGTDSMGTTNKKIVTVIAPDKNGIINNVEIEKKEKIFNPDEWSINRFQIGRPLSRGKFVHVLLVRERETKYLFIIKMMFKSQLKKNPKYMKNFRREIEIHSTLDHPNIVKMHGWFWDEKKLYIILEYCPDGELFSILQSQPYKRFSEDVASDYIKQMINALIYLHSNKIIHRDIKPENILVDNNTLKLADFGWSIHTPSMRRKTFWGTLDYLPPEMIKREVYDEAVDIWSIGVLAYELWSGHAPFHDESSKKTYERISNVHYKTFKYFSAELKDFIKRLLRKNPVNRMTLHEALEHPFITNHLKDANEKKFTTNCFN